MLSNGKFEPIDEKFRAHNQVRESRKMPRMVVLGCIDGELHRQVEYTIELTYKKFSQSFFAVPHRLDGKLIQRMIDGSNGMACATI